MLCLSFLGIVNEVCGWPHDDRLGSYILHICFKSSAMANAEADTLNISAQHGRHRDQLTCCDRVTRKIFEHGTNNIQIPANAMPFDACRMTTTNTVSFSVDACGNDEKQCEKETMIDAS
ncbi:unnamed protein product [Prorocentrum cordatum]|uniref:Uncharacterized protein n=1 Tax=Prorocentrum cordatum TaxID=2364126 RepID=A0ABN9VGE9_9DINO|nr:unnamed protein product [Polarella glacialis]